jgi:hypothetical protein
MGGYGVDSPINKLADRELSLSCQRSISTTSVESPLEKKGAGEETRRQSGQKMTRTAEGIIPSAATSLARRPVLPYGLPKRAVNGTAQLPQGV